MGCEYNQMRTRSFDNICCLLTVNLLTIPSYSIPRGTTFSRVSATYRCSFNAVLLTTTTHRNPRGANCVCTTRELLLLLLSKASLSSLLAM